MEEKNIHAKHRERLLEQIHKSGLENMTEVQVLEFILTFFIPRKDTNVIAHHLINEFGCLKYVLDASPEELIKIDGIGERVSKLIPLLPQIFFYYKESEHNVKKIYLNNINQTVKFLNELFEAKPVEELFALFLNANNKLVKIEKLASGDVNEVDINCQNLVNLAHKYKPSYIILSHNHPNGFKEPSEQDIKTTAKIIQLMNLHSFLIVDHIIIGTNGYYSFNQNNIISHIYQNCSNSKEEKFANNVYNNFIKNKNV